jgi:hypothetical protein
VRSRRCRKEDCQEDSKTGTRKIRSHVQDPLSGRALGSIGNFRISNFDWGKGGMRFPHE